MKKSVFCFLAVVAVAFSNPPTAGWNQSYVSKVYAENLCNQDILVFSIDAYPTLTFFIKLTGTEATRQMATIITSAFYKSSKVDVNIVPSSTLCNGWIEVIAAAVIR